MNSSNEKLMDEIKRCEIQDDVKLLGERNDIPALMTFIDFHVLSSTSEGFQMSCVKQCWL